MKTCSRCGSPNELTSLRCDRCGGRLPPAPSARQVEAGETPTTAQPVKSRVGLAVMATVLFIPFGLVALLHAFQVGGWYAAGHEERAQQAADSAQRWALAGIAVGVVVDALIVTAARFA